MILVSLPLKFCFAALVWLLSLCHSGVISSPSLLTSSARDEMSFSPCMVIHTKVPASNSVNFLPRCICSHLGRLNNSSSSHSLPMKVDVSVAHRDLINLKHSFGGLLWNTLGNHLVPWQSSWDLKLESLDRLLYQRFPLLEQIHWSSQGGNDPIVLWVTMNFQQQTAQIFFEPWSWNIKPNCKWRLSSFKRKNILSKLCNSPRQLQTMANHFSGRGKAQYYFKTWGTGMAPGLKNNYLKTSTGKQTAFFLSISMDGEKHWLSFSLSLCSVTTQLAWGAHFYTNGNSSALKY